MHRTFGKSKTLTKRLEKDPILCCQEFDWEHDEHLVSLWYTSYLILMITIFVLITDMKRTSDPVYRYSRILFLSGCSASSPGRRVNDDEKTVQDNTEVIDVGLAIEWEYERSSISIRVLWTKCAKTPKLLRDSVRAKSKSRVLCEIAVKLCNCLLLCSK